MFLERGVILLFFILILVAIICYYGQFVTLYKINKLNKEYATNFANDMLLLEYQYKTKKSFDNFNLDRKLRHSSITLENLTEQRKIFIKNYGAYYNTYVDLVDALRLKNIRDKANNKLYGRPDFGIVVRWSYTSPQGYRHYENEKFIKLKDALITMGINYHHLQNDDTSRLLNRHQYKASTKNQYKKSTKRNKYGVSISNVKKERQKLTKKLRYQVLARDHGKCVICGRSAKDGVVLHVDHIKPVSRGGKTELSNLRTLCSDCNLGKSASYNKNVKYIK